ncbi:transporter [Chloroflexales bacterium ZM16-3]|nr:transporter [Chloroflexales bacterium ZM16-3]
MVSVLLNVLLPIAVVVAIGYTLRRVFPLDQGSLNRVMIYGLSPALIFVSLLRANLTGSGALQMIALSVGLVALMGATTLALAWPLGLRGGDLSAMLLVSLFMNSGNYGLPAARFAFGEEGFTQALFFFIAQSIMAQTLGVAVAAAGGAAGHDRVLREALRRMVRMPQIYAVMAALLIRATGFDLTAADGLAGGLFNGVALLSEAALPLMLVILGMQLGTGVPIEQPGLVALATGLRLVISPALAYGLGLALGLHGMSLAVGVMLGGMPTAVNTAILAIEFDCRPTLVVGTVVASSLASLLTLTVLLGLLHG